MPNRFIKESICTSESIDQLSWFDEVFFYRLIVNCDDFGRFDARPIILKARLFPLKEGITLKQIEASLSKLSTVGMVQVYMYDQKPFLQLKNWGEHQQTRAVKSKYPNPTEIIGNNDLDNNCYQMISDAPVFVFENDIRIRDVSATSSSSKERRKYGTHGWVRLSDDEYERLIKEHGDEILQYYIGFIDESAQQTGNKNKWKDWNLTIRKAIRDKWGRPPEMQFQVEMDRWQ